MINPTRTLHRKPSICDQRPVAHSKVKGNIERENKN